MISSSNSPKNKVFPSLKFVATVITASILVVACAALWVHHSSPSHKETFVRAVESLNAGDSGPAKHLLRALQRIEGFEQHCELLHGGIALKEGRPDEALTCFARIRPEGDIEQPALLWTGEALYRTDQLSVSLDCFRRILEQSPDNQAAIRWIAAINFDLCAMDDALRNLRHLLELNPNDFAAHRLMGTIYFDFEKWNEAADSFRLAYQRSHGHPLHQKLGCELARTLLLQHEYDEAAVVCTELNVDESVLSILAECSWIAGDPQNALKLLSQALEIAPSSHEANLLSGRINLQSGDLELAVTNLKAAIQSDPFDFDAHFLLTAAYRQLGQQEQAEKQFATQETVREFRVKMAELNNRAINNPSDAKVRFELAELCRNFGHIKLARIWKKAALGCSNSNTDPHPLHEPAQPETSRGNFGSFD